MTIPDPYRQQLAEFPAPLRALVEAEIRAGNSIVAIENGFPQRRAARPSSWRKRSRTNAGDRRTK
jgi:hypothetical protein